MADTAIRIYILFLCINIVLMLGGFSIDSSSDIYHKTYGTSDASDASGWTGFLKMIDGVKNLFFGGGITGLLLSAGMPYEIQVIVGAPFFVLGVLALAPLLTVGAGVVGNLIRWI